MQDCAYTPNWNVAVPSTASQPVYAFTKDITRPKLTHFKLDLDYPNSQLTLIFNEPISPSKLDVTSIVLQSVRNASVAGASSYRLKGGSLDTASNIAEYVLLKLTKYNSTLNH